MWSNLCFCPWSYSPGCCWPLLLLGLAAGLCHGCCPPGPPGTFPTELLLGQSQAHVVAKGLSIPVKDFAFFIAEFHDVPVSPFLQVPWALPLNISSGSSISCHCKPHDQEQCCLLPPIGKDLKQVPGTGSRTDHYGVPLVANLQVEMSYYPLPSKPNQPSRL